jgi:hypothetical protein
MRLVNIQDGIMKAHVVQQFQERAAEVARASEAAQAGFREELARQADEVILETNPRENYPLSEDEERNNRNRGRRRRRRRAWEEEPTAEELPPSGDESPEDEPPHKVDITI